MRRGDCMVGDGGYSMVGNSMVGHWGNGMVG